MQLAIILFLALIQTPTPASQTPKAAIAGRVVKARSGDPLGKAIVTLRPVSGQRNQVTLTTAVDGIFSFNNITPGQYLMAVTREGYIRQEFGQRTYKGTGTVITIGSGQVLANINFQLIPAGTIAGRILDEDGEPLAGIQVQALSYRYQGGRRTLVPGRAVETNDLGEYRLYWLTPDQYVVSAIPRQTRNGRFGNTTSDEAYAPSYFPGNIDPESATPIQLAAAAEVRGIDFILRPVQTVTLKGRIVSPIAVAAPAPRGQPPAGGRGGGRGFAQNLRGGIQVVLTRSGNRAPRGQPGKGIRAANADGTFEIPNVIPGSYTLTAVLRQDEKQYSARTRVEVADRNIENINLSLQAGIEVPGQIYLDGAAPAAFRMEQVRVALTATEDIPAGNLNTQPKADGTFVLSNVPPLAYRVTVAGLPADAYAMAGRYGSADALNEPLQVDGTQTLALQLQIGFAAGRIDGSVVDNRNQPVPGTTCVLIPVASRQNRPDLYKTAATDQFGRFAFTGIAPGDYKVFAWEDIPQGDYQDPAYVSRFEDRGRPVRVEKGGSMTLQVTVIPAG